MSLSDYTDEDLLEELAGRERRRRERAPIKPCDECRNFKAWDTAAGTPLDDYNPCQKEHRMSFKEPDSPTTYDWGFYRRVCADRAMRIPEDQWPQ